MFSGSDTYSASQFLLTIMTQCSAENVQFSPPTKAFQNPGPSRPQMRILTGETRNLGSVAKPTNAVKAFAAVLKLWDFPHVDFANFDHAVEFRDRQDFANIQTGIEDLDLQGVIWHSRQ